MGPLMRHSCSSANVVHNDLQTSPFSKAARSQVKPTFDVEEQSEVDALNTELDNAANEGRPARTRSGRVVVRPAELDFFINQR